MVRALLQVFVHAQLVRVGLFVNLRFVYRHVRMVELAQVCFNEKNEKQRSSMRTAILAPNTCTCATGYNGSLCQSREILISIYDINTFEQS